MTAKKKYKGVQTGTHNKATRPPGNSDRTLGDIDGQNLRWDELHPENFDGWSKTRRVQYAVRLVLFEGYRKTDAAKAVGCSYEAIRARFADKDYIASVEAERDSDREDAGFQAASGRDVKRWTDRQWLPHISQSRRVGTPWGFQQHYFGHVICPDCGVHHPQEEFHVELLKTWHHPDTRRFITNLPPYHAKTTVFSVWDTIYDLARDPNSRTLIVSKTQPFVKTIVMAIQQWLTDSELYHPDRNLLEDFGPFRPSEQTMPWSTTELFVHGRKRADGHPNVLGVGATQQIYGRRADRIKADDIATLENTRTLDRINKLMEWIDKELLSRIGRNARAGFAGTRVGPGDIYGLMRRRLGYKTMSYPAIIDDNPVDPKMLWPGHFDYPDALNRRSEMSDADWQLVYQQVELSAQGLAFSTEDVAKARDEYRTTGHYDSNWLVVGGVDLAGSRKTSGYTVIYVHGVDRTTETRYAIDIHREKSMTPDRMRQVLFRFSDMYPVTEWRVEANAIQDQIIQMNNEITRPLASKGIRVTGHQTGKNKWDPTFGVESMVPLFVTDPPMFSVPWRSERDRHLWTVLLDELSTFPLGHLSDTAMALWFAELGVREWLQRDVLPVFSSRRVPMRIARNRRVINVRDRTVARVPVRDQGRLTRKGRSITYGPEQHKPLNPDEW